ncbi:signal peptidase I [Streptomyces sp. ACA25]|uniref:signal peptidase I n=1 Tax=Streptomyces sp. ACA25 TaxID=3022596 RepID=UPI0023072DBD|nr:signal peptidase I [Streptomyces sp. ACA25]MDB1089649.1 signal peptidase I [Streptomyces sp. ACA25]
MNAARRRTAGPGRLGSRLANVAAALGCVLFLGGFVLVAILYQPYTVPTDSMAPTVRAGDRVLAHRIDGSEVRRGDIVVFREETWGGLPMIKRVVGVGGDSVACCDDDGLLMVNGEPVPERYLGRDRPASPSGFETEVPAGELFLLGDRRLDSLDSRTRLTEGDSGSVPQGSVTARVEATVWPLDSLGLMPRPSGFARLPGGVSEPGPLRELFYATAAGAVLILGGAAYGPIARRAARKPPPVTHNEGTRG